MDSSMFHVPKSVAVMWLCIVALVGWCVVEALCFVVGAVADRVSIEWREPSEGG
jgi:hypothetical protein